MELKSFKKFIPSFLLGWYHFLLSFSGAVLYHFPSRKIIVIGVTGTNGKTTVTHLATEILEESGSKVASLSSIRFKIGAEEWPNTLKMTMPGRFKLQKFLRQAVDAGCKYLVLEVTSEGIKQHRHKFINFDTAVFTNLSLEHIESHGSFEKYRQTKGKLFATAKRMHIVNLDDENAEYFLRFPAKNKIFYSIQDKNTTGSKVSTLVKGKEIKESPNGVSFKVDNINFDLQLLGRFNIYNALAAICIGKSQGVGLKTCKQALEKAKGIAGRMEVIIKEPFTIIVDYSHTPDSLGKVCRSIKNSNPSSKIICLLGSAGGGRDKWKRPEMGKIAADHCHEIILANEDPYDESPEGILAEIKSGIIDSSFPISNLYEILDRKEAIKKALSLAQPNDVVIITGKGCEPWMCIAHGKKIHWDDREIVKEVYNSLTY